jgi:mannose-6-phosphate isomerase-like protein (cupin superfamily)
VANQGTETKLWGVEEVIVNRAEYCAKFLRVKPGYTCSLHRHRIKTETFHVLHGSGVIGVGDSGPLLVQEGLTVHIPPGKWHFFASREGMTLLEISTEHSDEDVERASPSHRLTGDKDATVLRLLGVPEDELSHYDPVRHWGPSGRCPVCGNSDRSCGHG